MSKRLSSTTLAGELFLRSANTRQLTPGSKVIINYEGKHRAGKVIKVDEKSVKDFSVMVNLKNRRVSVLISDCHVLYLKSERGTIRVLPKHYDIILDNDYLTDSSNIYFAVSKLYLAIRPGDFTLEFRSPDALSKFIQSFDKTVQSTTEEVCDVHPCTLKNYELLKYIHQLKVILAGIENIQKDMKSYGQDKDTILRDKIDFQRSNLATVIGAMAEKSASTVEE